MDEKETLGFDTCNIMLDFDENCQYVLQDEIQSFHQNNSSYSIHSPTVYYNNIFQEKGTERDLLNLLWDKSDL